MSLIVIFLPFILQLSRGSGPVWFSELAIVRGQAELPCSVPHVSLPDKPLLVLWYKGGQSTTPIYSYDTRRRSFEDGVRWTDDSYLGTRAEFRINRAPPTLVIRNVRVADSGTYTCRVEYTVRPFAITRTNLSVIVPPGRPLILDSSGREIMKTVGPLKEGSKIHITCKNSGGAPTPSLSWWVNGEKISEDFQSHLSSSLESKITLWATRESHGSIYSCQALNNNITDPMTTSVTLDVLLRPLLVEILGGIHRPLYAEVPVETICRAVGSQPSTMLSLKKGDEELQDVSFVVMNDRNVTSGTTVFRPTSEDDGKTFSCRAWNPDLPGSTLETSIDLKVFYKPRAKLALGRQLIPDQIKEGDDVYFECTVGANPEVFRIKWFHDGVPLETNKSAGLIISSHSLVLQSVNRERAGSYACSATNLEGEGLSNSVYLDVMYAPVCLSPKGNTKGVTRFESTNIECRVEAHPTEVTFNWKFNGTTEGSVPLYAIRLNGTTSVLNYTASSEQDYGTLLCWASNRIGTQRTPCSVHLAPAVEFESTPEPPTNCSIANQSSEAFVVRCTPGFDGGLPQTFLMEAWEGRTLLTNTSSYASEFVLRGLEAGMGVTLRIRSTNEKGTSAAVSLEADIMKVAEKRMGPREEISFPPIIGAVIGGVGAVLVLVVVGLVLTKCFYKSFSSGTQRMTISSENKKYEGVTEEKNSPDVVRVAPDKENETDVSQTSCLNEDENASNIQLNIRLIPQEKTLLLSGSSVGQTTYVGSCPSHSNKFGIPGGTEITWDPRYQGPLQGIPPPRLYASFGRWTTGAAPSYSASSPQESSV